MKQIKQIRRIPVTREGFEKLKRDYDDLKKIRPQAVDTLSDARKMGDLSENGLYTAAKMRLKSIDSQMFRISIQIKLADIIEENKSGVIGINSKVKIDDGVSQRTLHIVGRFEADPVNDKISSNSPIGRGLLRKKSGDTVEIVTPSGKRIYKILEVF